MLVMATQAAGNSEQTADFYVRKLRPLVAYLGDKPVSEVTLNDLRRFVVHLRGRTTLWDNHPKKRQKPGKLSEATIEVIIRATKRLFGFLKEEKEISEDPAIRLKKPKLARGEPKAASMKDFIKLLDAIEGDDKLARRNRAMLLILADTACTVGGLVGIRVCDVELGAGKIYPRDKGNKGRYAFLTPMTREALEEWLAVRPANQGDHLWTNLGSQGGDHLTTQGVREFLRRLKQKAGGDRTLFGAHLVARREILLICEGELNAVSFRQVGHHTVDVVSFGPQDNFRHAGPYCIKLASRYKHILVWVDEKQKAIEATNVLGPSATPAVSPRGKDANQLLQEGVLADVLDYVLANAFGHKPAKLAISEPDVTLVYPTDAYRVTIAGKWSRLDDGRVEASYTRVELLWAMMATGYEPSEDELALLNKS